MHLKTNSCFLLATGSILIGVFGFVNGCGKPASAPYSEMQDRAGQVFRINEQAPYSGNAIQTSPSGFLLRQAHIDRGWVTRLTAFHPNGNTHFDCRFNQAPFEVMGQSWEQLLANNLDHLTEEMQVYHPDGMLKMSMSFLEGRPDGICRFFHTNGAPEQIIEFQANGQTRIERFAEEGWKTLEINLCQFKPGDLFTESIKLRGECAGRLNGAYFLMHNEHTMAERALFECGGDASRFETWTVDGINPALAVIGKPFVIPFQSNGADMQMIWVPPGSFRMGAPADEPGREADETLHPVSLTDGFWLASHETTQEQWQEVMGNNPSYFEGEPTLPVESIDYAEAMEFCDRLTARSRSMNLIPDGFVFSLPTEAQWEYACRAGTSSPFSGDLEKVAWYHGNSKAKPHPVGTKQSNAWGFHDMHGNVWEMCLDWEYLYPDHKAVDPVAAYPSKYKVVRGASWAHLKAHIRSANRGMLKPGTKGMHHGMRIALIPLHYHQTMAEAKHMAPSGRNP